MKPSYLYNFEDVIVDVTSSFKKVKKNQYEDNGKTPIIDQSKNDVCGYTNLKPKVNSLKPPYIIFGDHTRCFKFLTRDFILGADGTKVLKAKIDADHRFLFYYLKFLKIEEAGYSRHFKFLKRFKIYLPPLVEQQRIATLLDSANNMLHLYKLSIRILDKLAQSMFIQMDKLATNKFKLNEISEIKSGATPKSKKKEYWNGKICWATPRELNKLDDIFINTTLRKITSKALKSCSASLLPINSILFSSRAPIGHIAINTVPMTTNQGFKSFIVDKNIVEPIYLYYWLNHNRKFLQDMGVGATFKELSKNLISSIKIDLPDLSKQHIFVKKINSLYKIKIDKKNIILKHLKLIASLQQQSFGIN